MTDNAAIPPLDFILECYRKIQEKAEDGCHPNNGLSFPPSLSSDHGGKKHYICSGTSILIFCCPVTLVPWEVLKILPHIYCQIQDLLLK